MSIIDKIERTISSGEVLYTPSNRAPFTVEKVDRAGVTFRVGKGKWKITVAAECLEGIPRYLRGKGWVRIGSVHDVAEEATLEAYLDKYVSRSSSSYVVPLLERIKIIKVQRSRPAKIKLTE